MKKAIVVGAGISGATAAYVLTQNGYHVDVFETRGHIAGNCYDSLTSDETRVNFYGAHIFHTNDDYVWQFVNNFSEFKDYKHIVKAETTKGVYTLPLNQNFIDDHGQPSQKEIIDLVFRNYSDKMWGHEWEYLPDIIKNRIPKLRKSYNPYYFDDLYQGLPTDGYTTLIERMLDKCTVHLLIPNTEWTRYEHKADVIVYTGSLDDLLPETFEKLSYRGIHFFPFRFPIGKEKKPFVMNFCTDDKQYTRVVNYDHFNSKAKTTFSVYEVPFWSMDGQHRFYPYPDEVNMSLYSYYKDYFHTQHPKALILGRLGSYRYLNMDEAIKQVIEVLDENSFNKPTFS